MFRLQLLTKQPENEGFTTMDGGMLNWFKWLDLALTPSSDRRSLDWIRVML